MVDTDGRAVGADVSVHDKPRFEPRSREAAPGQSVSEIVPTTPAERRLLSEAYHELVRADYHLAVAARLCGEAGRPNWERVADQQMRNCVALRDSIQRAEL